MEFGVHLPLISFAGEQRSLDDLLAFTEAARDLGYTHLCANDHLVFSRPWLDGPTALAAVLAHSGQMTLATTVAVPVLRGPAATAKILAAIDVLSGGRLLVGLGPGSSARDYELVGVPFEERWKRLDEAVQTLRAYWRADDVAFEGAFYSTAGFTLAPTPAQRPGPPIWIGSWGSAAGSETRGAPCRRLARLRLQHDPGAVRPGLVGRPGRADGARARRRAVPERHRNDVVLRHRGPGSRRSDAHGRAGADAQSSGGAAPRDPSDRLGRGMRARSCWRTRARARNASSCGRSPTSALSSSCFGNASFRSSKPRVVEAQPSGFPGTGREPDPRRERPGCGFSLTRWSPRRQRRVEAEASPLPEHRWSLLVAGVTFGGGVRDPGTACGLAGRP